VRGIVVDALLHSEYLKLSDKSTAKAIFTSLCSNYEGNKKAREAKVNLLVHQYELFKMKEDENIETMFSRFETLVYGLQILKKSHTTTDHVKKIMRNLPAKWGPKVTSIEEARDLNGLRIEDLVSSLNELGLIEDETTKKSKFIALKSKGKSSKDLKVDKSD